MAATLNVRMIFNKGERDEQKRKENVKTLLSRCPKLKEINTDNLLNSILQECFPEGFTKEVFIRNLSVSSQRISFGLRLIRSEGDFCDRYLDDNQTLLFTGHRIQKEDGDVGVCSMDSIQIVQNTEKASFEAPYVLFINPKPLPRDVSFVMALGKLESIRLNTSKNLELWQEYLKWRRELANKQIHGAKYFSFKFNEEKNIIDFALIFKSKEDFDREKRFLKRDACVFNNRISLDFWNFSYDRNLRGIDREDIGALQGFSEGCVINGTADENPISKHEHPTSNQKDKEIEATSKKRFSEDDVKAEFKKAYIVHAFYKLPADLLEELDEDDEEKNNKENKAKIDKYLSDIPNNGFLALSAAGEFALIRRFENAIKDLKEGNCYSQTLINWLFDVKRAALPSKEADEISEWANPEIAENENQRLAVEKALNADELFLLQGPPGTGKTTVIAEIIYQFVKKGLRVLVSSQSNDAVDNALDRLSDNPSIRTIRLGGRGGKKKKKNGEEQTCKYIEKDALKYYYMSLSKSISSKYLDSWNANRKELDDCKKDFRDFSFIKKDLSSLTSFIGEKQKNLNDFNSSYQKISNQIKKIQEDDENKENLRRKYDAFKTFIETEKAYDVLPDDFNSILEEKIKAVRSSFAEKGITIPENFISAHFLVNKAVKELIDKLSNSNSFINANSELSNLEAQIKRVKDEYLEAIEAEDDELISSKKKEWDKLKLARDKLKISGGFELSNDIRNAFSKDLQNKCKAEKDSVIQLLKALDKEWNGAVASAEKEMQALFCKEANGEIKALLEKKNSLEGKIKTTKEELDNKKEQRKQKQNALSEMMLKYKMKDSSTDIDLSEKIESRIKELENEEKRTEVFRSTFSDTMQAFCKNLEDEKTYKYDNEYFIDDYINACNVVGISCTNNMKNLSDKGFDNFDVVIIDEVSKATPPELLIPLMKAGKVILVGDHRQLPPMFEEHEKSYKEMIDELSDDEEDLKEILTEDNFKKFKNMVTSSLFKAYFEAADDRIKHSLLTQYRMHSDIMNVINRFYDGRLKAGLSSEKELVEKKHGLTIPGIDGSKFIIPKNHVYWIDSSVLPSGTPINETFYENSTSACNILEKYLILELLKKIAHEYKEQGRTKDNPVSIGIISFYQRQVNEIRSAVKELRSSKDFKSDFESLDIDVNTVDRFQGKEKNIIITSLVRNNKYGNASKHVVTYERINVAFSRAQNMLFIVGAEHTYAKQKITIPKMDREGEITLPVYENIISELRRKACFASSSKLIDSNLEKTIVAEYKNMSGK